MNKTGIEWVRNPDGSQGYTWNPITGCLNHVNGLCKGGGFPCYAYKLAHGRLKASYEANKNFVDYGTLSAIGRGADVGLRGDDPFYPRFWEERLEELERGIDDVDYQRYVRQKGRGIFVCDMGDLFGLGVPEQWTRRILEVIGDDCNAMHRFYLLTKQPQRLSAFSPFPENCWVGVTATNASMAWIASKQLSQIEARVKFLSLEPLLSWETSTPYTTENIVAGLNGSLDWLIIGACTGTGIEMLRLAEAYKREDGSVMPYGNKFTLQPKIEWLREIVEAADKAGIPVFLKDNIVPAIAGKGTPDGLFYKDIWLRQEMPSIPSE